MTAGGGWRTQPRRRGKFAEVSRREGEVMLTLEGAGTGLDHCEVLALDSESLWGAVRSPDLGDRIAAARSIHLTVEQMAVLAHRDQPFVVRRAVASRVDSAAWRLAVEDPDPVVRAAALRGATPSHVRRLLRDDPAVNRYLRLAAV